MALLSFCQYSYDPPGAFTINSIKNDSNKCLCVNQVNFLDICFCWILFYIVFD
jgi:hypothetical protein